MGEICLKQNSAANPISGNIEYIQQEQNGSGNIRAAICYCYAELYAEKFQRFNYAPLRVQHASCLVLLGG
jgi:hypothetical protein